ALAGDVLQPGEPRVPEQLHQGPDEGAGAEVEAVGHEILPEGLTSASRVSPPGATPAHRARRGSVILLHRIRGPVAALRWLAGGPRQGRCRRLRALMVPRMGAATGSDGCGRTGPAQRAVQVRSRRPMRRP